MLEHVVAVIGPPASGKSTLTRHLGQRPGYGVFRIWEHISVQPYELADNFTVIACLHAYVESLIRSGRVRVLLLDGFPGTGTQVSLSLSLLRQLAPRCAMVAVELAADAVVLSHRARDRATCEARQRRYELCAPGIRRSFALAGLALSPLDTGRSLDESVKRLAVLIAPNQGAADAS
jgi:adenylate kinase family enzyme